MQEDHEFKILRYIVIWKPALDTRQTRVGEEEPVVSISQDSPRNRIRQISCYADIVEDRDIYYKNLAWTIMHAKL